MNLVPLFEEALEFQNYNGTVLSNGKAAVYYIGRTRLADIYNDVAAEYPAENPRILNNLGMGPVYVNPAFDYELVVFDEYNNELFSVKKYLHSKGEHSTANVVVTPSENIAVSAWTVGDVQVYMPYLTGQLGKVYQGIDPIVVNNTEDKISAQHVPLGVQDPLYFVQDDEEGCIIGFSGQTIPEGVMTESALGFEDNKITGYNGSAFSAGNEYEAGNNIDITNGVISGKDWSNEINDASAAATAWTDSQGYLTGVDLSEYAKTDFVISAIDSSTSGLLPTSAFATASGSFITALPSDLATTGWVDSQGYLTAVDIPESAVWNATTQTVSANSAQWAGGTANPQIPVTSTSGISIFESGDKVYFNISADYAFTADLTGKQDSLTFGYKDTAISSIDNSALYDNSAHARITTLAGRISDLSSNKLDTAIYANDSGTFLTGLPADVVYTADIQDMATTGDLTGKQDITGMTAYATVESLTAKQDAGDYLSASDSANFLLTSDSGNFYPMNQNPSGYLTAHQSLADYQTTADMVNYQTTAGMTAYLTGVPDTYLQNTDLSTTDGKVTAISGIPLSAGGDVPEGVMVESAVGYNAVNEISGYNGSAIAQYGAEKQWLQHDDTIVHVSNSAQYAFGVNLSAVAQLLGVDETVLWTNPNPGMIISNTTLTGTLNESISSFEKIRFDVKASYDYGESIYAARTNFDFIVDASKKNEIGIYYPNPRGTTIYIDCCLLYVSGNVFSATSGNRLQLKYPENTMNTVNTARGPYIYEIRGIGRKQ